MALAYSEIKSTKTQEANDVPGDIIFVSIENWDEVWRRNQFFVSEFARRAPGQRILFVGLDTDVTNDIRRGRLTALRDALSRGGRLRPAPDFPNVFLLNAVKWLPNTLTAGRKFNEWVFRRQVRAACRELGIERPLLWINPQYAEHMVGRMGERASVYDITDDWAQLTQNEGSRLRVIADDAALCRKADAVIVCSEHLYKLKRPLTDNLHLIMNGVDAAHYRRVLDGDGPLPAETAQWQRPVFGYTGTVHPDRVDVELIRELALKMTHGTLALVGPNMLREQDMARLHDLPNVVLTGAVPYTRLPDYMRAFDVSITPHKMTPFTESLNPIKLWEYLAAGKPIVSTDVAGFRDYPQYAQCAKNADEFYRMMQEALTPDLALAEARRVEARQCSWTARVDSVVSVMETCLRRGRETPVKRATREERPHG